MCVADTRPLVPDSFDPPITIDFVPPRLLPAQACERSARPSPPDCTSAHRDSAGILLRSAFGLRGRAAISRASRWRKPTQ